MNGPFLELRDVCVRYRRGFPGEVHALDGISCIIRSAERVGLLGAAGAGKSTLLQVVAGLLRPDTGARIDYGTLPHGPSFVFQFPERQLFAETVFADVAYGLVQGGVPRSEVALRVETALQDVGLPPPGFAGRSPFVLSGGEKRRVALAGALAQRRGLVLLDEPTLGLDREGVGRLIDVLDRLHAKGISYWVASHDTDFVARVCDRLLVLKTGRLAFQGDMALFWGDAEEASRLGVRLPRNLELAAQLRRLGLRVPANPGQEELVAALGELSARHRPRG